MKVRPGGPTGCANIPDNLILTDANAFFDTPGKSVQMGVGRLISVRVANTDVIAETPVAVGAFNHTRASRHDGRPGRSRKIHPIMHFPVAQNGVTPRAERGTQASPVDRSRAKFTLCGLALGIVIIFFAIFVLEQPVIHGLLTRRE